VSKIKQIAYGAAKSGIGFRLRRKTSEAGGDLLAEARKSAATWQVWWCSAAFLPHE